MAAAAALDAEREDAGASGPSPESAFNGHPSARASEAENVLAQRVGLPRGQRAREAEGRGVRGRDGGGEAALRPLVTYSGSGEGSRGWAASSRRDRRDDAEAQLR